jgi:hypothetical protein
MSPARDCCRGCKCRKQEALKTRNRPPMLRRFVRCHWACSPHFYCLSTPTRRTECSATWTQPERGIGRLAAPNCEQTAGIRAPMGVRLSGAVVAGLPAGSVAPLGTIQRPSRSLFSLFAFPFSVSPAARISNLMDFADPLQKLLIEQATHNGSLHRLVEDQLTAIIGLVPAPSESSSSCLLADIGDYLVRSSTVLSRLADSVASGPHIESYVNATMDVMERETGFSDLQLLEYMNSKHSSLQYSSPTPLDNTPNAD